MACWWNHTQLIAVAVYILGHTECLVYTVSYCIYKNGCMHIGHCHTVRLLQRARSQGVFEFELCSIHIQDWGLCRSQGRVEDYRNYAGLQYIPHTFIFFTSEENNLIQPLNYTFTVLIRQWTDSCELQMSMDWFFILRTQTSELVWLWIFLTSGL